MTAHPKLKVMQKSMRAAYEADWSPAAIAREPKHIADANATVVDDDDIDDHVALEPEPELEVAPIFTKNISMNVMYFTLVVTY